MTIHTISQPIFQERPNPDKPEPNQNVNNFENRANHPAGINPKHETNTNDLSEICFAFHGVGQSTKS
jgi:hypothetical protein